MILIKELTIKNFLSIGNVTQSINFSSNDLVLVLGENMDLGGNDNRNGVGKSAIVNALSFALYGEALTRIRKDNLVNASNLKQMYVTLTFQVNNVDYKIERGRKPNIFKFIKNGVEKEASDESQGESRHTQEEIEKIIGISHDMFKHILALNTYVEPFLSLRTNDQRIIIEQLLGITKLSEKAEKLKEEIRNVKDKIKEEEFRISAATEANKRIELNIKALESKSNVWESAKQNRVDQLNTSIHKMLDVDIDSEIVLHKSKKEVDDLNAEYQSLAKELAEMEKQIRDSDKNIKKISLLLSSAHRKICPTCSQIMDRKTEQTVHSNYSTMLDQENLKLAERTKKRDELFELAESVKAIIPPTPITFYDSIDDAYQHKTALDTLGNKLRQELETCNPFTDQIDTLRQDGLQVIDFSSLNKLVNLRDHQEFLLKLLTNKDSFIRKKIIDQNLSFLNFRLKQYLVDIGLPHEVKFKSDLEVEISMFGKEFDFDNLSRGERTRLILSLSWAFRDVFESMNDKINLLFIDELIDSGLDTSGVESSLSILKKMNRDNNRNIYLISHRDELIGRVPSVLKVVKSNGFTTLEETEHNE